MAAIIIPMTETCSASKRLPQLLHFAIPAFFSNLKCNQIFEGYFGSAETSTNNRSSNFLLVDILFENTDVSDVSSFTFRNNFRTKNLFFNELRTVSSFTFRNNFRTKHIFCNEPRTTPISIAFNQR